MLRDQRGYLCRDARPHLITRFLEMDQIERKRLPGDPEAGYSASKKNSLMAILLSTCVADKEAVKRHGD